MNRKERSFDRPYTVRRSDCSGDARPGSFLESPWLSCPKSASSGKALRSERVASCLCTCAHDSRQVALVSRGASPQSPLSSNLGFRADSELGPESPATSDGGDIWGLTWARATGRWGRGETSWSETNRQLISELTPHLPGRQTTGPAHPQGQPPCFLPLPRRLGQQSTFRHRRGCKDISRQLVAAHCTS